jgi:hypothetical protein
LVKRNATYEKDIHPCRAIGARDRSFGDWLQSGEQHSSSWQHQSSGCHASQHEQVGHPTIWECLHQSRAWVTYAWLFAFIMRHGIYSSILALTLLLVGCGDKSNSMASGANSTASSGNPLDAPGDYLKSAVKAQRDANMTLDTNSLTKAIDLFKVDKGRNPKDLDELVKERYIPSVPKPPFGTKIVYDSQSGRVNIVKE